MLIVQPIAFLVSSARRRTEDTLGGEIEIEIEIEIVAAVVRCAAAAPVAIAGGMTLGEALAMWGAWSLAYAATVRAARHVIARHRGASSPGHARRWSVLVCVALGGLITLDSTASFTAPLVAVALAVTADCIEPAARAESIPSGLAVAMNAASGSPRLVGSSYHRTCPGPNALHSSCLGRGSRSRS